MSGSSESDIDSESCQTPCSVSKTEDYVNRRAGHIAVAYENSVIVWGGYSEVESGEDGQEYWPPGDIWHYSMNTNVWRKLTTTGDIPNRCSGSAACVIDDCLYIAAGFHQVFSNGLRENSSWSDISDSDDDFDEPRIIISNRLWKLDLKTRVWKVLSPSGIKPLCCDKTTLSSVSGKAVLFGGFGPPPPENCPAAVLQLFQFQDDFSTEFYRRGWSNQLVCYHSEENKWVWPSFHGTAPSPRAAHSATVVRDKIYIFGGRYTDFRLNDLHCLDTTSMTWTNLILPSETPPIGRSWQSLTALYQGDEKGYLFMYGGFDNDLKALSDCWKLDLSADLPVWERQTQLEAGPRLWHTSVAVDHSAIMVIGGLTNNVLAPDYVTKHHAEKVIFLRVSASSLQNISLDYISKHPTVYKDQLSNLPLRLRRILEIRLEANVDSSV